MSNYLDQSGLTCLWGKIKGFFPNITISELEIEELITVGEVPSYKYNSSATEQEEWLIIPISDSSISSLLVGEVIGVKFSTNHSIGVGIESYMITDSQYHAVVSDQTEIDPIPNDLNEISTSYWYYFQLQTVESYVGFVYVGKVLDSN